MADILSFELAGSRSISASQECDPSLCPGQLVSKK